MTRSLPTVGGRLLVTIALPLAAACGTQTTGPQQSPLIAIESTTVAFIGWQGGVGPNPMKDVLTITNGGGGTLSGLAVGPITYDPGSFLTGWLTATLSGGTAPVTLTLTATPAGLKGGSATVPITSSVATNAPQVVNVSLIARPLGGWIAWTSLSTPRSRSAGGVVNGMVYAVGGAQGGTFLSTVTAYDPTTDTWTTKPSLPSPNAGLGVGVVSGVLYAVGGSSPTSVVNTVEAFDPATGVWTNKAPIPTARTGLALGVVNGVLYAVGGYDGSHWVNTVEAYQPGANTWTTVANMPTPRGDLGVGVVNGILYAAGGQNDSACCLSTVEAYDPVANTWTTLAPLPTGRQGLAVGVVEAGHELLAVGGQTAQCPSFTGTVEAYDQMSNRWFNLAQMPTARGDVGVGVVNDVLYAMGGATNGPNCGDAVISSANEAIYEP